MNNCPICEVWEMMPYHKRWSTPMSPQEGEGALAAGWWAAFVSIKNGVGKGDFGGDLCARHTAIMLVFNEQHERRKQVEYQIRTQVTAAPGHEKQVQDFIARASALTQAVPEPVKPPIFIPSFGAAPPPIPIPVQPAPIAVMTAPPPVPAIMTPPSVESFPCPSCGKVITNGQVHVCETEEPEEVAK
jgi:hypothetical protein